MSSCYSYSSAPSFHNNLRKGRPQVYAFEREWQGQKLLVLNNFYADPITVEILPDYQNGQVLISNYEEPALAATMTLKPYETLSILVK